MSDIKDDTDYGSIVRNNLMKREGYSPYCGGEGCPYHWPRMSWTGKQFKCRCEYETKFPDDFIAKYKARWAHNPSRMGALVL